MTNTILVFSLITNGPVASLLLRKMLVVKNRSTLRKVSFYFYDDNSFSFLLLYKEYFVCLAAVYIINILLEIKLFFFKLKKRQIFLGIVLSIR